MEFLMRREPSFSIWFALQVQKIPASLWTVVIVLEALTIYYLEKGQ